MSMPNPENPADNVTSQLDKLTLELMINKKHYNRYIEKADPKKYEENREFRQRLRLAEIDIIDITSALLHDPKHPISVEVQENFEIYVKSVLKHLDIKRLENQSEGGGGDDADDEILFNPVVMGKSEKQPMKSFWSKDKVSKLDAYNIFH